MLAIIFSSCYDRKAQELYPDTSVCDTTTVTFSATILPIVSQHCAVSGCHNSTSTGNGLIYTHYADLAVVASNGQLINAIKHQGGLDPMPKNLPMLDACTINKIVRWVNQGYQNN
jgi:hypothetical protein